MALKHLIEFVVIAALFGGMPAGLAYPEESLRETSGGGAPSSPRVASMVRYGFPVIEDRDAWPKPRNPESLGMTVAAASAIVADRDNGKVLFVSRADEARPIASLTKLMTVLVALEEGVDLDSQVTITAQDQAPAHGLVFDAGDTVTVRELVIAAIAVSGNDAARALARRTGLTDEAFVRRMHEKAAALGMMQTVFAEPTGIDPRNVSTARELVTLLRAAMEHSLIAEAAQRERYGAKENTNLLLKSFLHKAPFRIAFGKTGTLEEAGYGLAAVVEQGDHGVIVVVLGNEDHFSRFEDAKALAYWALTRWQWKQE